MPPSDPSASDLSSSAIERAAHLYKTLRQHESELSASRELNAGTREKGLTAVRRAMEVARRLANHNAPAVKPDDSSGGALDSFDEAQPR